MIAMALLNLPTIYTINLTALSTLVDFSPRTVMTNMSIIDHVSLNTNTSNETGR